MMSESAGKVGPFVPLEDAETLEQLYKLSHSQPVVLFKHSTTCPISSAAYEQMSQLTCDVALLVVQRARHISSEVERRTGVRHESPQAIILLNGEAVWNTSHWRITSQAIESAVHELRESV